MEKRNIMTQKIHATPGGMAALQAKVGIVVFTLFLVFGIVFGFVVLNETRPALKLGSSS
jgi:hypothetical protein